MAPIEIDRRKEKTKDLENRLTPLEIAELLDKGGQEKLPFLVEPVFSSGDKPVLYDRSDWGTENVSFHTAKRGATKLLVTFGTGANGVGVPMAYFLQMLRDDLYDVLVLHDRRLMYFDRGVPGFSESFLETTQRIDQFVKTKNYAEVITFGVSMGGFPALRAGLLLGAKRAISLGGVQSHHIRYLVREGPTPNTYVVRKGRTPQAFDVLCPCFSDREIEMVAVAAAQHQMDMLDLATLRQSFPACHVVLFDTERHNLMAYLHQTRLLRLFCACLFEYWESDIRDELLALLNRMARYSSTIEAQRDTRMAQLREKTGQPAGELERVGRSNSWRLTKALRSIAGTVRRFRRSTHSA